MKKHMQIMRPGRQSGAVLLVGMVMLLILMLGAVSLMNASVQDERMTGNTRRATDAFLAAEAGMQHALYVLDEGRWFTYSCDADPDLNQAIGTLLDNQSSGSDNVAGQNAAAYTVEFTGACTETAEGVMDNVRLRSTGTQAGSTRVIEFMSGHSTPSWPALFLNDNGSCLFNGGTSNNFLFDGNGGAAIGSNSASCRDTIESDILAADRRDRYDGEIINYNPAPDFTSAEGLEDFYDMILANQGQPGVQVIQADPSGTLKDNDLNGIDLGTTAEHPSYDADYDPTSPADQPNMTTTVMQGDLTLNGSISGAGVLVITGTASFKGTPDWDGIIIVLGGHAEIRGGGNSNTGFEGTMIVSNINYGGDPRNPGDDWEDSPIAVGQLVEWDTAGGGGGNYTYYCYYVQQARTQLATELAAAGVSAADIADTLIPDPNCSSGDGTLGKAHVVEWYERVEP